MTISLTWVARGRVLSVLNVAQAGDGGLEKLSSLLSIFEKVTFSADELGRIKVEPLSSGASNYSPGPGSCEADFTKEIPLKVVEAKWLGHALRAWMPNATIRDHGWLSDVLGQLEG